MLLYRGYCHKFFSKSIPRWKSFMNRLLLCVTGISPITSFYRIIQRKLSVPVMKTRARSKP
eukprot:UN07520